MIEINNSHTEILLTAIAHGDDNFKQMATQIKLPQMPPKMNLLEQIDYKYTTFKTKHVW